MLRIDKAVIKAALEESETMDKRMCAACGVEIDYTPGHGRPPKRCPDCRKARRAKAEVNQRDVKPDNIKVEPGQLKEPVEPFVGQSVGNPGVQATIDPKHRPDPLAFLSEPSPHKASLEALRLARVSLEREAERLRAELATVEAKIAANEKATGALLAWMEAA